MSWRPERFNQNVLYYSFLFLVTKSCNLRNALASTSTLIRCPALSPLKFFALHSCHVLLFRFFSLEKLRGFSYLCSFLFRTLVPRLSSSSFFLNTKKISKNNVFPYVHNKMEICILIHIRNFLFSSFCILSKHDSFTHPFA